MKLTDKELEILSKFVSWLRHDTSYDNFCIHKHYPQIDLQKHELSLENEWLTSELSSKFDKKTEFYDVDYIEGIKGKVQILNKEGLNFIHQNLKILSQYISFKGMFIQDFTFKSQFGKSSVIGGSITLVKDKINYWDNISIMFSTDVNVSEDKISNKAMTKKNRKKYLKLIEKSVNEANIIFSKKVEPRPAESIEAYSIIKMKGCYRSFEGVICKEKSYCLNLIQAPEDLGLELAKSLRVNFSQESVLISIGSRNLLISE